MSRQCLHRLGGQVVLFSSQLWPSLPAAAKGGHQGWAVQLGEPELAVTQGFSVPIDSHGDALSRPCPSKPCLGGPREGSGKERRLILSWQFL